MAAATRSHHRRRVASPNPLPPDPPSRSGSLPRSGPQRLTEPPVPRPSGSRSGPRPSSGARSKSISAPSGTRSGSAMPAIQLPGSRPSSGTRGLAAASAVRAGSVMVSTRPPPLQRGHATSSASTGARSGARAERGVLHSILQAQNGNERTSYAVALREIQAGQKTSHWIWYVWPCLKALRPGTSKPHYSLPDMDHAEAYLRHPTLSARLEEITTVALEHLRRGRKPQKLFGSSTDADKFSETMTFFAVAAAEIGDMPRLQLFASALEACNGGQLDTRTMELVVSNYDRPRYRGASTATDILGIAEPRGASGSRQPDSATGFLPAVV